MKAKIIPDKNVYQTTSHGSNSVFLRLVKLRKKILFQKIKKDGRNLVTQIDGNIKIRCIGNWDFQSWRTVFDRLGIIQKIWQRTFSWRFVEKRKIIS